jgi:hypothetical protein
LVEIIWKTQIMVGKILAQPYGIKTHRNPYIYIFRKRIKYILLYVKVYNSGGDSGIEQKGVLYEIARNESK